MKKFRIRETLTVQGWTYVEAETEEEAISKLEEDKGDFREDTSNHEDTDWDSIEEVV